MSNNDIYHEIHRPQFHFTAKKNWLNDPNGLMYYKGEYHLFFQHNPSGIDWGNMTWGHAVSPDMVHWTQLENAIEPDELGTIYSGSGVVDWKNTTGFQTGDEAVMVCIYKSAGSHAPAKVPFTQSIAYSNDRGRTWNKCKDNPVIGHIVGSNRDPKVIWHEPTEKWIMALFLDGNVYELFSSPNLKEWYGLSLIHLPGASECPDIFELPIDGDENNTKWVFWGANGNYLIGTFDGIRFNAESEVLRGEWGANCYAAQTWSDIPDSDGRRIQIAWMSGGKYPDMPFNQQMSFPCELTLRTAPDGIRLFKEPVNEIENIHGEEYIWKDQTIKPEDKPLSDLSGDLFHIRAEFDLGNAKELGFIIRGEKVQYKVNEMQLTCLGKTARLEPVQNRIKLEILVDRTSIEVFGNDGRISLSSCFLPDPTNKGLEVYVSEAEANLISMSVYELKSAWL
jgi:sucrose-6-phosphate hydrolase SacC (GH32 family)